MAGGGGGPGSVDAELAVVVSVVAVVAVVIVVIGVWLVVVRFVAVEFDAVEQALAVSRRAATVNQPRFTVISCPFHRRD
jgi:uncharacterized membrane protein